MSVSTTLADCLRSKGSQYDILQHPHSHSSLETAETAHIPGDRLAKTVLLGDKDGYIAAVLPSTYHLHLAELAHRTGRQLALASEDELREIFKDCDVGAIPPVCTAYGLQTWLDDSLAEQPDVYFESGDHEALVHMHIDQFLDLMGRAEHARFSSRM